MASAGNHAVSLKSKLKATLQEAQQEYSFQEMKLRIQD